MEAPGGFIVFWIHGNVDTNFVIAFVGWGFLDWNGWSGQDCEKLFSSPDYLELSQKLQKAPQTIQYSPTKKKPDLPPKPTQTWQKIYLFLFPNVIKRKWTFMIFF
jgi:hypothetical protein